MLRPSAWRSSRNWAWSSGLTRPVSEIAGELGGIRRERVGLQQRRRRGQEVALALELVVLGGQLPRLGDRGAVVIGRVDLRRVREPAPRRAAERHVEALQRRGGADVRLVEDLLEVRPGQPPAVLVARPSPRVERAALELGREDRRVVAEARQRPGRRPLRRVRAVEALRVAVLPGDVDRPRPRRPVRAAAAVVVGERHGDAVAAHGLLGVLHVRGRRVGAVLVLDLVEDHVAAAVGQLVARDDRWPPGRA